MADAALRKHAPTDGFLLDQDTWATLWAAWRAGEDLPDVDFQKQMILVFTADGPNSVGCEPRLDGQGNVQAEAMSTMMGGPGFGYLIQCISREGVRSVNGKPLPGEKMPSKKPRPKKPRRVPGVSPSGEPGAVPGSPGVSPEGEPGVVTSSSSGEPQLPPIKQLEKLVPKRRVFHVRDYGAVPDGKTESGNAIRAAIAAAIAAAGTPEAPVEVVLEAGTYRVRHDSPRRGSCFPIHQATHVTVRGAGPATKIVITDPKLGGFQFGMGQQVTLRDLAIDYDPLPFCQGTVRTVDVEQGSFDLEVAAGYPTPDAENFANAHEPYGKWGMIVDPATRRIRAGTPDHFMTPRWEHVEGRVWRFFTAAEHYRRNLEHMRVGDAYVHLARGFGSAVAAQGCDGVRIENITVHASPGLAVGLIGNRGEIVVRGLQVRFAPDTDRLLTTDADGVHCQQNRSGPVIEDCTFEGMADDAINIYAPPNVLREIRAPNQWLVSPNCLILPGDRLQVLDPRTGSLRGEVRVVGGGLEQSAFLLTLDQPLAGAVAGEDHRSADTLYNVDACGAGFLIRRNHMRGNRRYGCLLRAGGGVVEGNLFEDTTGAGVVVTNEPDWPEGPMPWGVTIRGNRFLRGGTCLGYADAAHGAALSVRAVRLGHGLAEAESIRDVVIENNEIEDRAGAALFVGGATDVSVVNNRITASPDASRRRKGPAILIERSSRVTLTNNTVSDPRPDTSAAVEIGSNVAPAEDGVHVLDLNANLAPGTQAVDDRRAIR